MQIRFLGATNTVTGSKTLLTYDNKHVLVDCGLFQGYKQLRLRNWDPLPVDPSSIKAVILTHAHLDHSGYIPLLVRNGFRGRIYCSEATWDLCKILLPDSGYLLEEEAAYANRRGFSKHHPALPLYTEADAEHSLKSFEPVKFGKAFEVDGLEVRFSRAGHILGAASALIRHGDTSIAFSGDLGRPNDAIMAPPETIAQADYVVVESTYGNKPHLATDPMEELGRIVRETAARGGVTVIPSFAVGRAQIIMHYLYMLKQSGGIPSGLPVYLNSPMAVNATETYIRHSSDHKLTHEQCRAIWDSVKIVTSVEESIALNLRRVPMVIIAASGMATGGRVLHHLKAFVGDRRNTVLFAGYQAGGTRGAAMLGGADAIKIHGEYYPVRAQVEQIDNLSAHADSSEIIDWLKGFSTPPRQVFITHGEPDAADTMRRQIEEQLHWRCRVPEYLESFTIGGPGA
ncbi:MBL fold metallo-hydrolase RNA specificity domain-containing protein [Lacisediminimonas profundi]|uniref:MBL fold metallo-hydrolase RNA specificity domain-containing protein n=1 Tax=Lacisediminimonas profundi TaxID=2603856 RepID=UPI00124B597D|nr:MBL fold metallo-hydrolase [Lacisediminimonas profundi]